MSTAHTILVADDSLTIRKLVETILREEGFQVTTVTTGGDCLKQAAAIKPSLILLDYILPDMQGTEICRSLINSPETWEIPVLMMSSNGNAIRQLYQDLNNVADYLTKPFAPSVLKAVVGHLLQKDKPAEAHAASPTPAAAAAAPASATAAAAPAPAAPAMPKDFLDKVNRLLGLMENQTASAAAAAAPAAATNEAAAATSEAAPTSDTAIARRKKATRRTRKPVASAPASDSVLRKLRLALQKQLRPRMALIPEWELEREGQPAEGFFLSRILGKQVLTDLSSELSRVAGMPSDTVGALRCPMALLPLDSLLQHLQAIRATGELRVETEEETVLACLELGQVVLLTSNNPRNYCAGAAFDFQTVPHTVISEAVNQQEEQSLPFFTSLNEAGHLSSQTLLEDLLRTQGGKCLSRAYKSSQAVISFVPLAKLSTAARGIKLDFSLNQLLLACYRTVDDWFALEKVIPDLEATLVTTLETEVHTPELQLEADELELLEAVQPGRTIPELAEMLQKKPFEVCLILFRFIKLGMVRPGPRRQFDAPQPESALVAQAEAKPEAVAEAALAPVVVAAAPVAVAPSVVVEPTVATESTATTEPVAVSAPAATPEPSVVVVSDTGTVEPVTTPKLETVVESSVATESSVAPESPVIPAASVVAEAAVTSESVALAELPAVAASPVATEPAITPEPPVVAESAIVTEPTVQPEPAAVSEPINAPVETAQNVPTVAVEASESAPLPNVSAPVTEPSAPVTEGMNPDRFNSVAAADSSPIVLNTGAVMNELSSTSSYTSSPDPVHAAPVQT